jgi:hypothetical protein
MIFLQIHVVPSHGKNCTNILLTLAGSRHWIYALREKSARQEPQNIVICVLRQPGYNYVLWRKQKRDAALCITTISVILADCEKKRK